MEQIRYAVIGTGGIAMSHLRDFSAKPGVQVVGLCDPNPANLHRALKTYPSAKGFADARSMLRETKPDMVSVCTSNNCHHPSVIAALKAGAHVVCEKPMAMNVREAVEMEATRRKHRRLGLINFSYRNCPSFRFARELIRQGELGRLVRVNVLYLQSFLGAEATAFSWRNDITQAGFGALGDLGVHMIDAARFVVGAEFARVVGKAETLVTSKRDAAGKARKVTTDTNASFLAEFSNGVMGTFEATQVAPGYSNYHRLEVSGTRGTLAVLSERDQEIYLYAGPTLTRHASWSGSSLPIVRVPSAFATEQSAPVPGLLVEVLRGARKDYPSFDDGVRAQRVLAAVLKSNQSRSWEKV